MALETVAVVQDLVVTNPAAGDDISAGDDHIRNIKTVAKTLCWETVGTYAAAAVASVNTYTQFGAFAAGYDYLMVVDAAYIDTAAQDMNLRVTTSGGTPDAGANYTYTRLNVAVGTESVTTAAAQTTSPLCPNFSDSATARAAFEVMAWNPAGTTNPRHMRHKLVMMDSADASYFSTGSTFYITTTAVDGVQFYPASGNFTGTVSMYRRLRAV
jgi:hypothetical protein